jgi:hypothetical protein
MKNLTWIWLAIVLVACGGGGAKPAETPAAGPTGETPTVMGEQAVVAEIPAASGAVATGDALPAEVTSLPPPPPAADAAQPESAPTAAMADSTGPKGTIVGQAWYAGPACAQATWPPSCNGPYRATWVYMWSHTDGAWRVPAQTDADGRYTFVVAPGWYTIMFKTGWGEQYWHSKVNAPPFETVTANLVVDFGAR